MARRCYDKKIADAHFSQKSPAEAEGPSAGLDTKPLRKELCECRVLAKNLSNFLPFYINQKLREFQVECTNLPSEICHFINWRAW
jgi:hypothetical protein